MCERIISIVGAGMGGVKQLTGMGLERLRAAEIVMGAPRLIEGVRSELGGRQVFVSHKTAEMAAFLQANCWERAVFLVSGDTGFYSAASGAAAGFEEQGWQVELVPGISSLSWLAARLGRTWQDLAVQSCHGRDTDPAAWVRAHRASFLLLGGKTGVRRLCQALSEGGLGGCRLWVGENLAQEDERIESGRPEELLEKDGVRPFGGLCCAVVENEAAECAGEAAYSEKTPFFPAFGLPDAAFVRGRVPMTKSEIRAVSLSRLGLRPGAVCYDIGSGTGSVSVEMGLALKAWGEGRVFAVEQKEEALELTRTNAARLLGDWDGFHVVKGKAPMALCGLPVPTHVFIGGSGGALIPIVEQVLAANAGVRIVVNAVTPETVAELLECRKRFGFKVWEMVQISVNTFREVGDYHMPSAGNPVYIACMQEPAAEECL